MKGLTAIFVALSVPIMFLNMFGGIVSGIWLAILGRWSPIFVGIASMLISSLLLAFALGPSILALIAASKCAEYKSLIGVYFFSFLGSIYTYAVITIWCIGVMRYFMVSATQQSYIPALIWSYGVATGPLTYMASKERDNEGSLFIVFFASVAYILSGCWVIFGHPTIQNITTLFGSVMGLGMVVMFTNAAINIKREKFVGENELGF